MKKTLLVLPLLFFSQLIGTANAKDFGVIGNIYPIVEPDFLEQIQTNLKKAEEKGQIKALQQEMKNKTIENTNRLKPVLNITKTEINRVWYYDPTVFLNEDLKNQNGRIFYKAGSKINPLETISLSKALIFIDGDDEKQVKWAINQSQTRKAKIILIKGRIIDLMKLHKIRFYFDQNGSITKKLGIKFVPAIVEQKEKLLKVSEVAL